MVEHSLLLRGIRAGDPLTILQRTDQDFVAAILDELADPKGLSIVTRSLARQRDADGTLKLFQPVHRTFHIAVLEIACQPFEPLDVFSRLDSQKIDSAGLVLRRLAVNQQGNPIPGQLEGWRQSKHEVRGWIPFANPNDLKLDPDPARRRLAIATGNAEINRRLSLLQAATETFSESVSPLFVAPPQVCEAAQKTILYGVIPVTSSELSETNVAAAFSPEFVQDHLPPYLQPGDRPKSVPRRNETLTAANATDPSLQQYIGMLRQLKFEFETFGDRPDSKALFAALNEIQLPFQDGTTRPAGTELQRATAVLVDRDDTQTVTMPSAWSAVSTPLSTRIAAIVKQILDRRLALTQPQTRRFDELNRHYQIQAFVRVKRPDGCPPQLIWSQPSPPFIIAPWYDNSDVPPVQVSLPDILNQSALRNLKPNVAFAVPKDLFNALDGMNLQDLLEGKKASGAGLAIDWICGFNIPIITICAFIVLNIFLQLLNFIFQWIFFIKICIPLPRRSSE